MEEFIHRENLALYRKRLAEAKDDASRQVIERLLAEEEAREGFYPDSSPSVARAGKSQNAP